MRLSVIIPSRNEGAWLVATVRSIRENESPDIEIVHVDDASTTPEPDLSKWDVKEIRLPRRLGAARARAYGMLEAREDSDALITVDSHELFGPGDALAALLEETERFKTLKALVKDYTPSPWEAAVHLAPNKIERLAEIAVEHDALAYMGPCRQGCATINWEGGLLRVGWLARFEKPPVIETAAPFGGNYCFSRNALERIGGYPQLPGYFGFEEETLALLCAAHRVPIVCATELSPWHLYRSQGVDPIPRPYTTPESRELDNLAAVYRLSFGEEMWQSRWRKTLATEKLRGRRTTVPEHVLRAVETDEFTAYRDAIQKDFILRDEALLEELERRMAADQERRDALNQGG